MSNTDRKLLTADEFRERAQDDTKAVGQVYVRSGELTTEIKAASSASRSVQFTISSSSVDRMGDTIAVNGWKLDNFRKNPIVLWSHSPQNPIGISDKLWVEDDNLKSVVEFQPREISPLADSIYQMLIHPKRFLRATSVGFIPLKYAFSDDPSRRMGIDFIEQELTEFSVCSIPANPEALMDAKSAGIDMGPVREWIERLLDEDGFSIITKKHRDAIDDIPAKLRAIAKNLPSKARGASGQILRCANIAEKVITAYSDSPADDEHSEQYAALAMTSAEMQEIDARRADAVVVEDLAPEPVVEVQQEASAEVAAAEQLAVERLKIARARLELERSQAA